MKFKVNDIIEYIGEKAPDYKTVYRITEIKNGYYIVQLLYCSDNKYARELGSQYTLDVGGHQEDAFELARGSLRVLYG